MRKFTLLTSVLLTAPFAVGNVSAQCVATQDCASLGYTETSCENGGIKCPFGNAWACKANSETGRDNPDCTYGAIYYSDGTCVKGFISKKTAIGVVVYDENNEKWIVALFAARSGSKAIWSKEYVDVPKITNYTTEQTVINDFKSCENTEAMLALGEEKYPAAAAAKNYAPEGAENTKGKWCLPSAGILSEANNHLSDINGGLSWAKGATLAFDMHWLSSECDYFYGWAWEPDTGFYKAYKSYYIANGPGASTYARPVMKI